jgi:hypothetical protein
MRAKIVTEKVVVRGERMKKIIRIEGVAFERDLPRAYTSTGPRFARYENGGIYGAVPANVGGLKPAMTLADGWKEFRYFAGDTIPSTEFDALIAWMRVAGVRLAKINRHLAAENVDWHGEETVEI